jgi:hypothetical protein
MVPGRTSFISNTHSVAGGEGDRDAWEWFAVCAYNRGLWACFQKKKLGVGVADAQICLIPPL